MYDMDRKSDVRTDHVRTYDTFIVRRFALEQLLRWSVAIAEADCRFIDFTNI